MSISIKELADNLQVSKTTISKVIESLGIQDKLQKVGNRYMLDDEQAELVKSQILQIPELQKTQKTQTINRNETQNTQTETEKSLISLLETQISILQEQLVTKDAQINALTNALANALDNAQKLHAGTLQAQLEDKRLECEAESEPEQQSDVSLSSIHPSKKKGIFARLKERKAGRKTDKAM